MAVTGMWTDLSNYYLNEEIFKPYSRSCDVSQQAVSLACEIEVTQA